MALLSVDFSPFIKRRFHAWIEAHSIGFESPLSRVATYGEGAGARWHVTVEFAPMTLPDAEQLRSRLEALNGPSNAFLFSFTDPIMDPVTSAGDMLFADGTTFSDGTVFSDPLTAQFVIAQVGAAVAAQATTLTITALQAGLVIPAGTRIGIREPNEVNYQVVKVVESATASSGGAATVTIRPRLRKALSAGTQIRIGNPPFKLRLVDDTQSSFETGAKWTPGPVVEFVESFQ